MWLPIWLIRANIPGAFPSWIRPLATALTVSICLVWINRLRRAFGQLRGVPGRQVQWIDPFSMVANLLAPVYPPPRSFASYYAKFMQYEKFHSTILSAVRPLTGKLYFWIADADALKDIWADRETFTKPVEVYQILQIYGVNLVGLEGSDWRRHKAIAAPAFNEANVALVWTETIRTLHQYFDEIDETGADIHTVDIEKSMIKATLLVISAAGFGLRIPWKDAPQAVPFGHKVSFTEAVGAVMRDIYVRMMVPRVFFKVAAQVPIPYLSSRLNNATAAFDELRSYLLEIISSARSSIVEGKGGGDAALLRTLAAANMEESDPSRRLSDEELLSNVFVFFLAGHETSSHALAFTFILLALYPEVQNKIYEEACQVWPAENDIRAEESSYKHDFPKLTYTLATFRETLRLYPAEPRLAKVVQKSTSLYGHTFTPHTDKSRMHEDVHRFPVNVPDGSVVMVDITGVHNNPLHWGPDCKEFKPDRFLDTKDYKWPRNAFIPFAAGARACIGSRFALSESVCTIALLTRRFEILLPERVLKMDRAAQVKYMTRWTQVVTMTPDHSELRLRRRKV